MKVEIFYFNNPLRNWSYVCWAKVDQQVQAIIIDPFEATPILKFLKEKDAHLVAILNTHQHWDHTSGNAGILKEYDVPVMMGQIGPLKLGSVEIKSHFTPGHCSEHFLYYFSQDDKTLACFVGDLLFQGGVGRCMSDGDPHVLANSVKKMMDLIGDNTPWFPGHDYLENNLKFAHKFPFFQKQLLSRIDKKDGELINNTLFYEKQQNIFLWCLEEKNWEKISEDFKMQNPIECFVNLRKFRDKH